jgi:hypothetical protein
MKKYSLYMAIVTAFFGVLAFNVHSASAVCGVGELYNSMTGQRCLGTDVSSQYNSNFSEIAQFNAVYNTSFVVGSRGEDVKALQQFLKDQGYYFGRVDGRYGRISDRAVKDFQEDNDIYASNTVSLNTAYTSPIQTRSITVLSPNGGEQWTKGTTQSIQWTSTGGVSSATITLISVDTGSVRTLGGTYANTGPFTWGISNCTASNPCSSNFDIAAGNYYIKITDTVSGVSDQSDRPFSIVSPLNTTSTLSITTPSQLPNAKVGQGYSAQLAVSGGSGSTDGYRWIVDNGAASFPVTGLGFSSTYGSSTAIIGSPAKVYVAGVEQTTPYTFTFNITVTSGSQSVTKQFTLTVDPATVVTLPNPVISAIFPAGCSSTYGYNSITGESCSSARMGSTVNVQGANFNSQSRVVVYSSVNGELVTIPVNLISSTSLSFVMPSTAGTGLLGFRVSNTPNLYSNSMSLTITTTTTTTAPTVTVSPANLNFTIKATDLPSSYPSSYLIFAVNPDQLVSWTATARVSTSKNWISISPSGTARTSGTASIGIGPDASTLVSNLGGTFTGSVTFTGNFPTQVVNITLTVLPSSTSAVVTASDSDNSRDYSAGGWYVINPQITPDLFVKGMAKGIYSGSSVNLIFGIDPNPASPKPTSDGFSTYLDFCVNDSQLNEAYIRKSDGKIGANGVNAPAGYTCRNGAFVAI